jgi:hypothetical protein
MKYVLSMISALAMSSLLIAQNCSAYYYLQNNKTIEMTLFNKKDKETGKNIYTISNVKKAGNTTTATVNSEFIDSKGKSISKASNNIKCVGGVVMMDMKMFIPSAQQGQMGTGSASASDVYLEYPASMKEGDQLKDGEFKMDFKMESGMGGSVSVAITNRKVEGKESVTTPAGTWDCFKLTYHTKIIMKMGIGIPMNADVTEWYAPGFGTVKTESGGGKTEITSVK